MAPLSVVRRKQSLGLVLLGIFASSSVPIAHAAPTHGYFIQGVPNERDGVLFVHPAKCGDLSSVLPLVQGTEGVFAKECDQSLYAVPKARLRKLPEAKIAELLQKRGNRLPKSPFVLSPLVVPKEISGATVGAKEDLQVELRDRKRLWLFPRSVTYSYQDGSSEKLPYEKGIRPLPTARPADLVKPTPAELGKPPVQPKADRTTGQAGQPAPEAVETSPLPLQNWVAWALALLVTLYVYVVLFVRASRPPAPAIPTEDELG